MQRVALLMFVAVYGILASQPAAAIADGNHRHKRHHGSHNSDSHGSGSQDNSDKPIVNVDPAPTHGTVIVRDHRRPRWPVRSPRDVSNAPGGVIVSDSSPVVRDHRRPRPIIRDHRAPKPVRRPLVINPGRGDGQRQPVRNPIDVSSAPGGVQVTDSGPIIRDHRTHDGPIVRDHRNNTPLVRDHRTR